MPFETRWVRPREGHAERSVAAESLGCGRDALHREEMARPLPHQATHGQRVQPHLGQRELHLLVSDEGLVAEPRLPGKAVRVKDYRSQV